MDNATERPAGPISQAEMGPSLVSPGLTIAEVMTVAPRACSPFSTALEAVLIFRDADCGVIPVTDAGKPVGVLTDRDVALALATHETNLGIVPVGELMIKDLVTVELDEPLETAVDKLGDHGVRRVLVVDGNGLLQGILSWSDLVPHLSPGSLGRVVSRIIENR